MITVATVSPEESDSFISFNDSGREFQSHGAEFDDALNPIFVHHSSSSSVFMCLSSTLGMHKHDTPWHRHLPSMMKSVLKKNPTNWGFSVELEAAVTCSCM